MLPRVLGTVTLYNTMPGKKRGVEGIYVWIVDHRVEMPDHNGQGRQNSFVEMDRSRDVQPGLREEAQREIVGPQQQAGADHDDGAPDDGPVFRLFDIAVGAAAGLAVAQAQVIGEIGKRLARVIGVGKHFLPVFAELTIRDGCDQVRNRDSDEDGGGNAVDQAAYGYFALHQQQWARPPLIGVLEGEAGPDQSNEGDCQHRVLEAFERQHAQTAV